VETQLFQMDHKDRKAGKEAKVDKEDQATKEALAQLDNQAPLELGVVTGVAVFGFLMDMTEAVPGKLGHGGLAQQGD
jgi:hypothetical protein